jgi:hypothetical protein
MSVDEKESVMDQGSNIEEQREGKYYLLLSHCTIGHTRQSITSTSIDTSTSRRKPQSSIDFDSNTVCGMASEVTPT